MQQNKNNVAYQSNVAMQRGKIVVGNDGVEALGRTQRQREGSREESTTVWRIWGGLDDSVGSRENFGRKFW
jgi:hypothetical protein